MLLLSFFLITSGMSKSLFNAVPRNYKTIRLIILIWMTFVIMASLSVGGIWLNIPNVEMLEHTARNLYFHVPMWFTMMAMTALSAFYAFRYLQTRNPMSDIRSRNAALIALVFGISGLMTGIIWARYTWYEGTNIWWNFDPKQSMAAVQILIYGAYFALRGTLDDPQKEARIAAVYNLFAFVTVPFLLYVLPRQLESLHPGSEGNPAFSEITDPIMRIVFYASVVGFIALSWIFYTQRVRLSSTSATLKSIEENL